MLKIYNSFSLEQLNFSFKLIAFNNSLRC